MPYQRLFVFVEGQDDTRLIEHVFGPALRQAFDYVQTVEYACLTKKKIDALIKSAAQISGAAYFFLADNDGAPCVTKRKNKLCSSYPAVSADRALVVVEEIESWYLAGLDTSSCSKLKIKKPKSVKPPTKEQFNGCAIRPNDVRAERLDEILEAFDVATARGANQSFDYVAGRLGL